MRIWQQVGLADRLNADMQPGAGANFVDADGVSIRRNCSPSSRGATGTRRSSSSINPPWIRCCATGSTAFPTSRRCSNTNACASSSTPTDVELMLADLHTDEFKRIRASYVIAADGGSSRRSADSWASGSAAAPTRSAGSSSTPRCSRNGPATTGFGSTATPPGRPSTARLRWDTTAGSFRCATRKTRKRSAHRGSNLEGPARPGDHPRRTSRSSASRATATMCGSPTGGVSGGCSWPAMPPMPCRRGSARACAPVCVTSANLCWKIARGAVRVAARIGARHLPGRAAAARQGGHQPRGQDRQDHHRPQPGTAACAITSSAPPARCPTSPPGCANPLDSRRALPRRAPGAQRQPRSRAGTSRSRGSSTKRATGCASTTSSAAGGRCCTPARSTAAVLAISGRADHQNRTAGQHARRRPDRRP